MRLTNAGFTISEYVDLNGDGFPDWVAWESLLLANPPEWAGCGKSNSHWIVEFGTGSDQTGVALPWVHHACTAEWPGSEHAAWPFFLEDINGDGLLDYIKFSLASNVWLNDGPIPGLLTDVSEPAGGAIEFRYATSAQMTASDGSPANPGLGEIVVVATEIARDDGRGSPIVRDQYHYAQGRFDYEERQFEGFGVVTRMPVEANPQPEAADFVTVYATDGACAGTVLEVVLASSGRLSHAWTNVEILEGPSGAPQTDRFAACLPRERFETHYETAGGQGRRRYTRWYYDGDYNPVQMDEWGEIQAEGYLPPQVPSTPETWGGGFPVVDLPGDERTTCSRYATPTGSGLHLVSSPSERWVRSTRSCTDPPPGDPTGLAHLRNYYGRFRLSGGLI